MSGEKCNNWLNGWARVAIMLVVAAAAAVAFVWTSQAGQDVKINRHEVAIAVFETKLGSIDEKLSEIRSLLREDRRQASLKD